MRDRNRNLLSFAAAASVLVGASGAEAQNDIAPPLPNVALLLDTSGSMEEMIQGKLPEENGAACTPGTATPMNRWATLVSVLTGTVQNFSCFAQNRRSNGFRDEFTYLGVKPYDFRYVSSGRDWPFHRILSNGCTPGPGSVPATPFAWPTDPVRYHVHSDHNTACSSWAQENDGILDTFRDRARFALMVFDPLENPKTGLSAGTADAAGGVQGIWSYYNGWQSGGVTAKGKPANCSSLLDIELGARNAAAPPWEGRMVPFGPYDAALSDVQQTNARIQLIMPALRPYGATPIAGLLADARTFFWEDGSIDPNTNAPFGPKDDPYVLGACRKQFIVLLSDGMPNKDLRPQCEQGDGVCPFPQPWDTARELATHPDPARRVKTFVVGFAVSVASGTDCKTLTASDLVSSGGLCDTTTDKGLRACCNLSRIAYEGGTDKAYFADDIQTLRAALSSVLTIATAGSTSRTLPVFSSASASAENSQNPSAAPAASYQFLSSFGAPPGELWIGHLERKRYVCETNPQTGELEPILQKIEPSLGDDFAKNLNTDSPTRRFYTVIGDKVGGVIHSRRSIRPKLGGTNVDGLGTYKGATVTDLSPSFYGVVPPEAMSITASSCVEPPASTAAECAKRIVDWEVGEPGQSGLPSREGREFGAIYHSTPAVLSTPREFLRDESYAQYAAQKKLRPLMLYTATVDGQLHAFKVAPNDPDETTLKVDKLENNELWSFLPPNVLPRILSQYPSAQQVLLDGAPVVRDVVFERTATEAKAGTGAWRTVLVAGGGQGGNFYYALDVTDPKAPEFLWQLSTSDLGTPLFADATRTPGVAVLAVRNSQTEEVREVAVALLPGGEPKQPTNTTCPRVDANGVPVTNWPKIDPAFKPRGVVRCWGNTPARSLTIVRLDSGRVLRTLHGFGVAVPGTNVTSVALDSPITGTPIAYPSGPGTVANRAYVGDSDGTVWRINLADPDPADWTTELFFDAYSLATVVTPPDGPTSGQPIETPPVISVDNLGNPVLAFSTGDQELFHMAGTMNTRVWSITEKPPAQPGDVFTAAVNWYVNLQGGKRVTGPMTVFNSALYFSTFTPTGGTAQSCNDGFGSIWGVDYVQRENANDPSMPLARYTDSSNNVVHYEDMDPGVLVFGVGVTQQPTCAEDQSFDDPYMGSHSGLGKTRPGKFQLVFQTGTGGNASEGATTKTVTRSLPTPPQLTRIDSWAAVVE